GVALVDEPVQQLGVGDVVDGLCDAGVAYLLQDGLESIAHHQDSSCRVGYLCRTSTISVARTGGPNGAGSNSPLTSSLPEASFGTRTETPQNVPQANPLDCTSTGWFLAVSFTWQCRWLAYRDPSSESPSEHELISRPSAVKSCGCTRIASPGLRTRWP